MITPLQTLVDANPSIRSAIRSIAGRRGSSFPVEVCTDAVNPSPMVAGESWHYETMGGNRIHHPSAYSRSGWSNMRYVASARRIEVDATWLQNWLAERRIYPQGV